MKSAIGESFSIDSSAPGRGPNGAACAGVPFAASNDVAIAPSSEAMEWNDLRGNI
jgi:hypothetical protein